MSYNVIVSVDLPFTDYELDEYYEGMLDDDMAYLEEQVDQETGKVAFTLSLSGAVSAEFGGLLEAKLTEAFRRGEFSISVDS